MAEKSSKNKKGNKKHGRNKNFCEAYRRTNRREKNKALKIKKHLAKFPDDKKALAKLAELK